MTRRVPAVTLILATYNLNLNQHLRLRFASLEFNNSIFYAQTSTRTQQLSNAALRRLEQDRRRRGRGAAGLLCELRPGPSHILMNSSLKLYESRRDVILFCIDCSESMLELRDDPNYDNVKTCNLFTALEAAMHIQKKKVIAGPNDSVGILLFNTVRACVLAPPIRRVIRWRAKD